MSTQNLADLARKAIATGKAEHKTEAITVDPNTNNNTANKVSISIAKEFLQTSCPDFLTSEFAKDDDRLVKVGRSIVDLVKVGELDSDQGEKLESSLSLLVDQCTFFTSDDMKVRRLLLLRPFLIFTKIEHALEHPLSTNSIIFFSVYYRFQKYVLAKQSCKCPS